MYVIRKVTQANRRNYGVRLPWRVDSRWFVFIQVRRSYATKAVFNTWPQAIEAVGGDPFPRKAKEVNSSN